MCATSFSKNVLQISRKNLGCPSITRCGRTPSPLRTGPGQLEVRHRRTSNARILRRLTPGMRRWCVPQDRSRTKCYIFRDLGHLGVDPVCNPSCRGLRARDGVSVRVTESLRVRLRADININIIMPMCLYRPERLQRKPRWWPAYGAVGVAARGRKPKPIHAHARAH